MTLFGRIAKICIQEIIAENCNCVDRELFHFLSISIYIKVCVCACLYSASWADCEVHTHTKYRLNVLRCYIYVYIYTQKHYTNIAIQTLQFLAPCKHRNTNVLQEVVYKHRNTNKRVCIVLLGRIARTCIQEVIARDRKVYTGNYFMCM